MFPDTFHQWYCVIPYETEGGLVLPFCLPGKFCDPSHIRLEGSTTFSNNRAFHGGGIYNSVYRNSYLTPEEESYTIPTIAYPDDIVFVDNSAEVSSAWGYSGVAGSV